MNASIGIFAAAIGLLMLSGCTASPQRAAYVAPQHVGNVVNDEVYIAYVERVARRRGVGVTWINMPIRRVALATDP